MRSFRDIAINESAKIIDNLAIRLDERLTIIYEITPEFSEAIDNYELLNYDNNIKAVFGIKEDNYIDAIWARKGYGPVAYKIAIQLAKDGFLSPNWDRSRITKSAMNVWKEFYDGKGSEDVIKKLEGADETNYLNYTYKLKNKLDLSKNINLHNKFIGKDPYKERIDQLLELGEGLLTKSMRSIY